MKKSVIVVAGGSGSRMQSDLPKQFIKWCGKPILMHTIQQLVEFDRHMEIILVLPKNQVELWDELCEAYNFTVEHTLTYGGATRFESVKNGLEKVSEDCLVGVHDGVRPLVSAQTLKNCFDTAAKYGSAIPVIDAIESIRELGDFGSRAVARANYKMVQTPQVFFSSKLKEAYHQTYRDFFTDDASVYEAAGNTVSLAKGNRENIKITTPMDLLVGEALKHPSLPSRRE
ncbi:2-C-methyl-D-erythritol 4-phosphate cytidylyltransferase [Saccharicrinis carchari]|uniref:2-C-methyl-D-erythritol 4-phosphate cytidylyltransferase n=1 Tax=Saccharicrinis carchari TaxID=1168039 RepID=A0A521CM56_SACCC|nr:2-C-methyl-D-erythritol 4-phosphate cytidylyltransferase [Saccharicrinis carchari]SMO60445.1 2-C-methyl-D-erythritol 4-phosphate cytidylyltransferase [Saccharicrinis carchari]